jgi:hypothetical protein
MDRLADPTDSTRQGWHDTCGWTFLEVRLLTKDPDKISDKMAEVITTGRVSTYDWEKEQAALLGLGRRPCCSLSLVSNREA